MINIGKMQFEVKILIRLFVYILLLEIVFYYLLFGIYQVIKFDLSSFDYSLVIVNFDYNKIWISLLALLFNDYLLNEKLFHKNVHYGLLLFISCNILVSTVIFFQYRIGSVIITSINDLTKYFGIITYLMYGISLFSLSSAKIMSSVLPKKSKLAMGEKLEV